MRMLTVKPSEQTNGRVIELWSLTGSPQGVYSGLPKPYVELIISLSGNHFWQADKSFSPILNFKHAWVTPVQSGPRFAQTLGELHLIGARLSISAATELFGPDINIDSRPPIPLDSLIGHEASLLREQLLEIKTEKQRLEALDQWIKKRLCYSSILDLPSLSDLAQLSWRTDALANLMNLSSRGLRKRFKTKFGIGPKFWLQLNRFDGLLNSDIAHTELVETAVSYGYTDQSHMTMEFKRFAGCPPQKYLLKRKENLAPDKARHFLPNEQ